MTSQEDARRIAVEYLAQQPGVGATGIRKVRRWSEIPGGLPGLYWTGPRPSPDQLEQAWVAYLEDPGPPVMLKSSTIVIVDGVSGEG